MEITLIIEIGVGLTVLLAILIFLLFSRSSKSKSSTSKKEIPQDLNALTKVIKDKQTSSQNLKDTLDLILRDYGEIHDFKLYLDILYRITLHPNTNKDIILYFDKELSKLNPSYKKEIAKAVTDALSSR